MCDFAMNCVVPSVRLPEYADTIWFPRPVTAAAGERVRGALVVTAARNKPGQPTLPLINTLPA